ncbi:MAG: hypothetical protein WD604_05400 [Balneolaceae bacterium]
MRLSLILLFVCMITNTVLAQTGVEYPNKETSNYTSSMKSNDYTYLVWDRNDYGDDHFNPNLINTPKFFYWDNDDNKLHYLLDTGNMSQLHAKFNTMGIGISNSQHVLHVKGNSTGGSANPLVSFENTGTGGNYLNFINEFGNRNFRFNQTNSGHGRFYISDKDGNDKIELYSVGDVLFNNAGNVGIGTANPTEILTVAGTTKTEEVIVEENIGADFVFEEAYDLPGLSELETFIQANKHLPEIPPAEEMIRDGVKVGELQMKLLQKIEELTLYVIELEKRDQQKTGEIQELRAVIHQLREKME